MSKKNNSKENKNCVSIGGQAVLEGVMMRGESSMATAVRDAEGVIRVETKRVKPASKRNFFLRLPIIRGVVSFVQSLFGGMNVLMRSAEVYGEEEPSKFEKWLSKTLKINVFNIVGFLSVVLGLFLAIFLFMWLPQTLRVLLENLTKTTFDVWAKNFIEGGVKLLIFILYILLCSLVKDVKRTFMYHGAEHKTISCYEQGLPLTVENAKKCKRVHDRCGTTFMIFVMLISIVVFALFESLVGVHLKGIVRVLLKVALLPFIAGLSYELLKALSKTDFWLFYPLKIPGLLLQRITTKEPDDEMLEVAITAFKKVLEMDADPTVEEVNFVTPLKRNQLVENVKKTLAEKGITEEAESEWIVSLTLNVKRSELSSQDMVSASLVDKINKVVEKRLQGFPLWYCVGDVDFYGYTIKVDQRVLIPRPETELIVDHAKKIINENSLVLDLCTGSGAIAISLQKETNATVFASDLSDKALELAKENAILNNAKIQFIESDMFENIPFVKFHLIISNPPYIKTDDIKGLDCEVKDFEPMLALDGGADGLDFYRIIANLSKNYLADNGVLLLEIGYNQANDVCELLKDFSSVEVIKDYEGRDRIIKAVV